MKKLLALLLCLAMVLPVMTGCTQSEAPAPAAEPEAPATEPAAEGEPAETAADVRRFEGVELHMIAEQQTPTLALESQLGAFEELTGIKVVIEMTPLDNVVQKATLAMQSGNGAYDIVALPYQFLGNLVVNNYLQPLKPLMEDASLNIIPGYDESDIIKGMWDASGKWKDEIYGVAANSCIMFLGYRQDLFGNADEQAAFKEKYGYDLVVPTDWNMYRDVAEFFTRKAGETLAGETLATDFYGVSIMGKRHDAVTCEWLNYAWGFGGGIFDDAGNLIISNEKNVAALDYFNELQKFAPPGATSKTWDEQTTELAQGIACMAVMFNDCAPALEDPEQSLVVGKMGYGAIPVGEKPVAHYGAWSYFIPATSPNPEAAWVFLQWFNTNPVQKAIALEGGFPNLTSVYNDPELANLPYWQASMDAYEISTTRPRIPEWNEMNEELMLDISNVLSGAATSADALAQAQAKYETLLAGQLPLSYQ